MRSRQAGFTLIELVVTTFVLVVLTLGALSLLEGSQRISDTQTLIARLQSNHRVAHRELERVVAMAGIGGLPKGIDPARVPPGEGTNLGLFPYGLAFGVWNDVPAGTRLAGLTSPLILAGSDVVLVRGVLSTPVYEIEDPVPLAIAGGTFQVTISDSIGINITQDLEPLRQAIVLARAGNRPEAIILRDRYNPGAYAVFALDLAGTTEGATGATSLVLSVRRTAAPGSYPAAYEWLTLGTSLLAGSGGLSFVIPSPTAGVPTTVQVPDEIGAVGLLEERWYYLREEREDPRDAGSRLTPVLAQARFYPGTGVLHPDGSVDLVRDFPDLQAAVGMDLDGDGRVFDNGSSADEILFNHVDDRNNLPPWQGPRMPAVFARLSTLVAADRADRAAPMVRLGQIEDHNLAGSVFDGGDEIKVRKRLLQTVVELRNRS